MSKFTIGSSPFEKTGSGNLSYFSKLYKYLYAYKIFTENNLSRIVDIGAGDCEFRKVLNAHKLEHFYFAIEGNKDRLYSARDAQINFIGKAFYWNIDLNEDSLGLDGSYDLVLLFDIIEHLDNKENGLKLIEYAKKMCRPGGHLLISTPNKLQSDKLNWPEYHEYEYTGEELQNVIARGRAEFEHMHTFGWSMPYEKVEKYLKDTYNSNFYHFDRALPKEWAAVFFALLDPWNSRDVLIHLRKR